VIDPKRICVFPDEMSDEADRKRGDGVRTFLDRVYWVLGGFLLGWSVAATVGIYRRTVLELPIFGKVQVTETIIFTLISFSILLPGLHYVIATYRATARLRRWPSRFPGVPEEHFEIPKSFAWLRVAVFVLLVCAPSAAMQLCFWRMLNLQIEWIGKNAPTPLQGRSLFSFPSRPEPEADYANWRWVGPDPEGGEIKKSRITAAPGWEPWLFALTTMSTSTCALWFLVVPIGAHRKKH
jgi:hypothetical protein